jgi:hypothetical protein
MILRGGTLSSAAVNPRAGDGPRLLLPLEFSPASPAAVVEPMASDGVWRSAVLPTAALPLGREDVGRVGIVEEMPPWELVEVEEMPPWELAELTRDGAKVVVEPMPPRCGHKVINNT